MKDTEWASLYSQLLTEHRQLLIEHRALLSTLRDTPLYAPATDQRLYYNESEEDALAARGFAPAPDNPFEAFRRDEELLRDAIVLHSDIEVH